MPPENKIYRPPYAIISFERLQQLVKLGHSFDTNLEGIGYIVAEQSHHHRLIDSITVYHGEERVGKIKLLIEETESDDDDYNYGYDSSYMGEQVIPSSQSHFEQLMAKSQHHSQTTAKPFRSIGLFAGWAGTFASGASMMNKNVIIGSKYIKVNPQGTVIHNVNRKYTSVKNISKSASKKIFILGITFDFAAAARGEQTWAQAAGSTLINGAIYALGCVSAPLGVIAGAGYLTVGSESSRKFAIDFHVKNADSKGEYMMLWYPGKAGAR